MIAATLAVTLLVAGQTPPERFREHERRLTKDGLRIDPPPKWITENWVVAGDEVYRAHQKQFDEALKAKTFVMDGTWPARFRKAAKDYLEDYQNPVKLFIATGTYLTAKELQPDWPSKLEDLTLEGKLKRGWEYLRNPPKSRIFVRMGYILHAPEDLNDFGKLGPKLVATSPSDWPVYNAMIAEYSSYSTTLFKTSLFAYLDERVATRKFVRWEALDIATAYGKRYRRELRPKDLDIAIELAELARKSVPVGVDTEDADFFINRWKRWKADGKPTIGGGGTL